MHRDSMTGQDFIEHVRHRANIDSCERAERIIETTLTLFGKRLRSLLAASVAAQLPPRIGRHLGIGNCTLAMSLEEFYDEVAERHCCDVEEAKMHAQSVFETMCEALGYREVQRLRQEVPHDFEHVLRFGPCDRTPLEVAFA
jgi:uncharacterized protein (DUF2267 family)